MQHNRKVLPALQFIIALFLAWGMGQILPLYSLKNIDFPLIWISIVFAVMGIGFGLGGILAFKKHKTTIDPVHIEKASTLVRSGLYRSTRNPMYVGLLFLLMGWCIYLGSISAFLVIPFFLYTITKYQIKAEENILAMRFGQEYSDYKKSVRRWM